MNGILKCLIYLASISFGMFVIGRLFPKRLFHYNKFPFRLYAFEKNGTIYKAVGVQKWKDVIPDMSKILPFFMPSKKIPKKITSDVLELMIQETCIAEFTHILLCVLGFGCLFVWKGWGGMCVSVAYFSGNVPYVFIQRYNRPKLCRLFAKLKAREAKCN